MEYPVSDELFSVLQAIFPSLPDSRDPAQIAAEIKKHIERKAFARDGSCVALNATDRLVCQQLGLKPEEFLNLLPLRAPILPPMQPVIFLRAKSKTPWWISHSA